MKKQILLGVCFIAIGGSLLASTNLDVEAAAFGTMPTIIGKIMSFRNEKGEYLSSKLVKAKQGESLEVELPEIEGYKKPFDKDIIQFNNEDKIEYTYTKIDDNETPEIPEQPLPEIPTNPTPIMPQVPPINTLCDFKVYSELQDWSGNILIEEWNPVKLSGEKGSSVNLTKPVTPTGYVLVEDATENNYVFGRDFEAKFVYKLRYMNISQQVFRRVNFVDENGKSLATTQVDGYTFRGTEDLSTNKYIWERNSVKFDSVIAPEISGYTPVEEKIPGEEYFVKQDSLDTQVFEYTIHYNKK